MSDIAWPAAIVNPSDVEWGLVTPGAIFQNALTGAARTGGLAGTLWFGRFVWGELAPAQSADVEVLLTQLRGFTNRLLVHCPGRPGLLGVGGGAPLAVGVTAIGASSMTIDGLTPSINGIWAKADLFSIVTSAASGSELKLVSAAINSNGSGQATVTFEPPLRGAVADNAVITVVKPTARFMPLTGKVSWLFRQTHVEGHTLDIVEDIA